MVNGFGGRLAFGPQRGQQRDRLDLLLGQVVPADDGRRSRRGPGTAVDDALRGDDEVERDVVTGQRDPAGRAEVDLVPRGDRDSVRADEARGGGQGEL